MLNKSYHICLLLINTKKLHGGWTIWCTKKLCHFYLQAIKLLWLVSLDNNIKEFVPICRLKSTQAHCKTLYFLNYFVLDIIISFLLLFAVRQWDFQQTFLNKVIIIEHATHFITSYLIIISQLFKLTCLRALLIKHIWIEERADVFIVSFQTFQYQK